jgi:bisphosphoglycerate-independent phosphoglycerate mutase (AlkP superfamily)
MTDMVGHRGPVERGVELLDLFDGVMAGALDTWDDDEGLIIVTSDHGNLEDLSTKRHTLNPVPTLLWGRDAPAVAAGIRDLTDIAPAILRFLGVL